MTADDAEAARAALRGSACYSCGTRCHSTTDARGWGCCPACIAGSELHADYLPVVEALRRLGVRPGDPVHVAVVGRRGRDPEAHERPWSHVPVVHVPPFADVPGASPQRPQRAWRHLGEHRVESAKAIGVVSDPVMLRPDRSGQLRSSTVRRVAREQAPVLDALQTECDAIATIRRQHAQVRPPDGSSGCWTCGTARAPRARWRATSDGQRWSCGGPACVEPNRPDDPAFAGATLRALMEAWRVDGARLGLPSLIAADLARSSPWCFGQRPQPAEGARRPWGHLDRAEVAALVQRLDDRIEQTADPAAWEAKHARQAAEAAEEQRIERAVQRALAAQGGTAP